MRSWGREGVVMVVGGRVFCLGSRGVCWFFGEEARGEKDEFIYFIQLSLSDCSNVDNVNLTRARFPSPLYPFSIFIYFRSFFHLLFSSLSSQASTPRSLSAKT